MAVARRSGERVGRIYGDAGCTFQFRGVVETGEEKVVRIGGNSYFRIPMIFVYLLTLATIKFYRHFYCHVILKFFYSDDKNRHMMIKNDTVI